MFAGEVVVVEVVHKYNMHPNLGNLGHTHLDAILKLTQDNTDLPVDLVLRMVVRHPVPTLLPRLPGILPLPH
jgi:hypothetical protein